MSNVKNVGVLITNLGTPDAPTKTAVRKYLAEFLWDPRIVEIPRPLWWLILHGIILRVRPARSAKLYQSIWTENASPLLRICQQQAEALRTKLANNISVSLGMRYGQPAIATALQTLHQANVNKLIVLPLYPQYSSATVGSTFDAVSKVLQKWRWVPELHFIAGYAENTHYITALANSITQHWQKQPRSSLLLFSFHGIPKRCSRLGDPYEQQCHRTAALVAQQLNLAPDAWQVVFQSRFGKAEWLQPYCAETLKQLPQAGHSSVDIICPGFSADCLETLQEIEEENRHIFLQAGGKYYHYIPALNTSEAHIQALVDILNNYCL